MSKLLILLVIIIGVIAAAQLARVYELTSTLRGKREEDIPLADNRMNAAMWIIYMIVFYIAFIYLMINYGNPLPEAASAHGVMVDNLMTVNMVMILIVFFLVNTLLFWFAAKYYYRKDRKATFFAHDNKLELLWTVVPSIVLTFIIIYGLMTWNEMTGKLDHDDYVTVEVTGEQWKWYVRYPGADNELGQANWNLVDGAANPLGVVHADLITNKLSEIDGRMLQMRQDLNANRSMMSDGKIEAAEDDIYRLQRHKQRLLDIEDYDLGQGVTGWSAGLDDVIPSVRELHLPVDTLVRLQFRSKDVIHSAYMPHLRVQMNTVPGVPTEFRVTPTITTAQMREKLGDPDFDYLLLCNKICGASHYNMWIPVIVETQAEYDLYLKGLAEENQTMGVMTGLVEATEAPAEPEAAAPADADVDSEELSQAH